MKMNDTFDKKNDKNFSKFFENEFFDVSITTVLTIYFYEKLKNDESATKISIFFEFEFVKFSEVSDSEKMQKKGIRRLILLTNYFNYIFNSNTTKSDFSEKNVNITDNN